MSYLQNGERKASILFFHQAKCLLVIHLLHLIQMVTGYAFVLLEKHHEKLDCCCISRTCSQWTHTRNYASLSWERSAVTAFKVWRWGCLLFANGNIWWKG